MWPLLIMAGGRSRRMRAGGCSIHKALRRVGGQTLIERNITTAFYYGFTHIWIAVSAQEPELRAWVNSEGEKLGARNRATIELLVEDFPLGTIGAAGLIPKHIDDLLVVNVDNLTCLDLRTLFERHKQSGAAMSIACHEYALQLAFGELIVEEGWLKKYVEKPVIPKLISSGIYVLGHRAIDLIPERTCMHIPQLTEILTSLGQPIFCYRHQAWWIDINDEQALAWANEDFGVGVHRRDLRC